MKLRLRKNSIRLRLLEPEVKELRETGTISEQIVFGVNPTETLTYALKISEESEKISAQLINNKIEIVLPAVTAKTWADTEIVGLYETQMINDADELEIIIEKDFVCLDRPADADNANAFPHPRINC